MKPPYDGWWHVVLGTRSSWLPGDPRGFRDHDHRIHSSGDYKRPPPPGEHAALLRFAEQRATPRVTLAREVRPTVVNAIRGAAAHHDVPLLAASVADVHAHLLIQVSGASYADAKRVAGGIKTGSSYLLRDELPGRIWSTGTSPKPIADAHHLASAFRYITERQEPDAEIWGDSDLLPEPARRHLS